MMEESNSAFYITPNYRYHWFIDGVIQSSEEAQLIQRLLPKDKPYNVVLKTEKLNDTAQSTPPVFNSNLAKPTIDAVIQVSIIGNDEWDCKGRLGSGCNDGTIKNNITTFPKVVPQCKGGREQICIESQMSGGAIRHDRCCDEHPNGYWCNGPPLPTYRLSDCEKE